MTIYNGDPGLDTLDVTVNGRLFRLDDLKNNEKFTTDVASAMKKGYVNSFTVKGHGMPGSSAEVMIWDGKGPTPSWGGVARPQPSRRLSRRPARNARPPTPASSRPRWSTVLGARRRRRAHLGRHRGQGR